MFLPYLHDEALTQTSVKFPLCGDFIEIYPLTLGASCRINRRVRELFYARFDEQIDAIPEEDRADFAAGIMTASTEFSYLSGQGLTFFSTNIESMIMLVWELCRHSPDWPPERIKSALFPTDDTDFGFNLVTQMQYAVHRDAPEFPKLRIPDKRPRYEATPEELAVMRYRILMDKFHWTFDQVLALTSYQADWCAYKLPGEREQIEESYEMIHRNDKNGGPDVAYQPGTLHFDSPADWDAYKAEHGIE